jgi:hypothetical protein
MHFITILDWLIYIGVIIMKSTINVYDTDTASFFAHFIKVGMRIVLF